MKSEDLVLHFLKKEEEEMKDDKIYWKKHQPIDPLILPLCILLNEYGYITLYSCSGHIKTLKRDQIQEELYYDHWYVLFYAKKMKSLIRHIVNKINKTHGYQIQLVLYKEDIAPFERWKLEEKIDRKTTEKELEEKHRNIYLFFKQELEQSGIKKEKPNEYFASYMKKNK